VQAGDPARALKTTDRGLYDRGLAAAREAGLGDLLFLNDRGELAESAIANVFAEVDGRLVTPPLAAGVLPGVLRAEWLAAGNVVEQSVTQSDAEAASALYLVSSLRGVRRCVLQDRPPLG
jgi:branched-subunit amino acid aminotransferase/4-amino-4-deoxychorismate lyase